MTQITEGNLWIISGEIGAGKTILCAQLIQFFNQCGWQIKGLYSPAIFEKDVKTGIAVVNLATLEKRRLAIHAEEPNTGKDEPVHWTFDPQVLRWGNDVFLSATPTELLVVDEIGPLEMKRGEGWTNALKALDSRQYRQAILVMRPALLQMAQERWPWGKIVLVENVAQVPGIVARLMASFED